jgi:hypothetical protein
MYLIKRFLDVAVEIIPLWLSTKSEKKMYPSRSFPVRPVSRSVFLWATVQADWESSLRLESKIHPIASLHSQEVAFCALLGRYPISRKGFSLE